MNGNSNGGTAKAPAAGAAATPAPPELDRMAVKISHLDRLLGLTGEIIISASNISILQRHLSTSTVNIDKNSMEMIKNVAMTTNRISSDLHHLVMDIRMVPIKETFLRFRRLVRDLAKKRGRQVNFEIVGEDTLVDKTVAERLYEPLAHQIRNAVDHGLEDPLERKHVGKPPAGQLTLTAYKKEGFTYVSVSDDGHGLNEARIRQVAVEKGFLPQSAAMAISPQECWNLIMLPGFSTTTEATEISGRGVGMDVVKSTVENLGGEIIIDTKAGKGTSFTYKIPQLSAVNITDALIIRSGESYYAVPIGNVVATQSFSVKDIHTTMERTESITYLGTIVPLYDLRGLLTGTPLAANEFADYLPVIIIDAKNGRIALKVSEFIRPQKLVLIPLPEIFSVRGVAGTTILGGSQLGMVLDPFDLIAMSTGRLLDAADGSFMDRSSLMGPDDEFDSDEKPRESGEAAAAAAPGAPASPEAALPPAKRPQEMMDESMAEEFYVEIQNILNDLNEEIFQLEKDPENIRRVNTIFRHFHSIKGNFIMTGFTNVGTFVHEVETVLDQVREKELQVTQDVIDLLLDAVKNMEGGIREIQAGRGYEVRDPELLAELARYKKTETKENVPQEPQDDNFHLSPLGTILYFSKINTPGTKIYQSLFKIGPSFQETSLVAYLIVKRIVLLGDLIDTVPGLERIEKGLASERLKVMFSSTHSLDEVNNFCEKQLKRFYNVVEFENLPVD
ncbi:MAG: Hpt domain-containing protein [Deltaproteobacteria bacterium]|jgi:chemotaxis protein histidine kinase CheA|nr:Hpt domain-containing protein [Deltaproteobacteria bacterium]